MAFLSDKDFIATFQFIVKDIEQNENLRPQIKLRHVKKALCMSSQLTEFEDPTLKSEFKNEKISSPCFVVVWIETVLQTGVLFALHKQYTRRLDKQLTKHRLSIQNRGHMYLCNYVI